MFTMLDGAANLQRCAASIGSPDFSIKSISERIQELAKVEIKKARSLTIEAYQGICNLEVSANGELLRVVKLLELNINNQAIISDYVRNDEVSRDAARRVLEESFGSRSKRYSLHWESSKSNQEFLNLSFVKSVGKVVRITAYK